MILVSPELSDAITLVASTEVAGFEVSRLQSQRPSLKWRPSALTGYIKGNLGAATTIRYVFLGYANAKSGSTWRVRFATTEANLTNGSASYDSTVIPFWPSGAASVGTWTDKHARWYDETGKTATWFQIDIDHSASGDSYFEAGRLAVGTGIVLLAGTTSGVPVFPLQLLSQEPVVETVDMGGEASPRPRRLEVSGTIKIWGLSDTEALGSVKPFCRARGSSKDVVIDFKPEETVYPLDYLFCGRIKESAPFMNPFYNHWEVDLKVTAS